MSNRYASMLPQPPVEDTREAVGAFREFAEAIQNYAGPNMDVEVTVSVHPQNSPGDAAEVQLSVYVPKTDYLNLVLTARCEGSEGFPVEIDPYFANASFPQGLPRCQDRTQLDSTLKQFAHSPEVKSLLEYIKRHAQPRSR